MKRLVSLAVLAFFVAVPQCFGLGPPDLVEICHMVPLIVGTGNGIIIDVPEVAVQAHLDHGDCLDFTRLGGMDCFCSRASSKRFKEDIHDMGKASTGLMRLRPVTFRYKKEHDSVDGRLQYGLIAEEVAEVYPELVVYDDEGRAKAVLYQQLSGMLLNELQKQHQQVQELTERLLRLEQVLTAQQSLTALTK